MTTFPSQRGFTLTELGIVVGVIAILMTVVMMGRGMMTSARVGNAVQLINTIRDGARSYSMRTTGGVSFAGVSIANLQAQEILPADAAAAACCQLSPFNPKLAVGVAPVGALSDSVMITVCTPTPEATLDLQSSLNASGGSIGTVVVAGNCVQVTAR